MLYNELRPSRLSELVGQDNVNRFLQQKLAKRMFSHAYLFYGERGTGKTTTARIVARAAVCPNVDEEGNPCGTCPECQSILNYGFSANVRELNAAFNNGISDIRDIIEDTELPPQGSSEYKVYIIDEVHMLTGPAFECLLKTMEEPPSYCIFILCTTEFTKVPTALRSRCQSYSFGFIDDEVLASKLLEIMEDKGIKYEADAVYLIAHSAHGGMRDALSILEKCIDGLGDEVLTAQMVCQANGLIQDENLFDIVDAIANADSVKLFTCLDKAKFSGVAASTLVEALQEMFADIERSIIGARVYNSDAYTVRLEEVSLKYYIKALLYMVKGLGELIPVLRECTNPYTQIGNKLMEYLVRLSSACSSTAEDFKEGSLETEVEINSETEIEPEEDAEWGKVEETECPFDADEVSSHVGHEDDGEGVSFSNFIKAKISGNGEEELSEDASEEKETPTEGPEGHGSGEHHEKCDTEERTAEVEEDFFSDF